MTSNRSRWLLRLALLPAVAIALLLWAARGQSEGRLLVENHLGQPLPLLEVTVGGQVRTFRDVAAGADVNVVLGADRRAPLKVEVQLADGRLTSWKGTPPEGARLIIQGNGEITVQQSGSK